MSTFPTDAERDAVVRATLPHNGEVAAQAILDALAPLVADRERAAAARALREAYRPGVGLLRSAWWPSSRSPAPTTGRMRPTRWGEDR